MICKGKSVAHTFNAINYGLSKDGAKEVCREGLSGENAREIAQEIVLIQSQNVRCRNNLLRIELSPTIVDGNKLTLDEWESLAQEFMARMGLAHNRQWLCVLHNDKEHKHLHIYANRINFDGKAFNDSHLTLKCAKVAELIAIEQGMTTAMSVRTEKQRALQPIKDSILRAHSAVFQHGMDVRQYQSMMKQHGVSVELNKSLTTGLVTGMRYVIGEVKIKASDIARSMSYNKLFGEKTAALHAPSKTMSVSRLTKGRGEATISPQLSATLRNLFGTGAVSTDSRSELDKLRDRADAIENQESENIPEL